MRAPREPRWGLPRGWLAAAGLLMFLLGGLAGCIQGDRARVHQVQGGNAERGEVTIVRYGCGTCHAIPGVEETPLIAGPPLTDWTERQYIAGALYNTPEHLVHWIMSPQAIEPGTAMPDLGLSEAEARDVAAYLYTLGDAAALGPPHPFPVEWLEGLRTGDAGEEAQRGPIETSR